MPDVAGTGNTAPVLTTVTVLVFLWALIAYSIRLYVKLRKSDGWSADDSAITVATCAALARVVVVDYAVRRGYGTPWEDLSNDDRLSITKSLYVGQILYIACVGATKVSTALFTANVLARGPRSVKIARTSSGFCAAWTVASIFGIALRGNLTKPWETYEGSEPMWLRWITIEAAGFAIDLTTAAIVAYFVYDLQMKNSKKLAVSAILNCRLVLGVPVAFRLYYLYPSIGDEHHIPADIISGVIAGTVIIFASITCLKPFLRPFDAGAFGTRLSKQHTGLFNYAKEHDLLRVGAHYYELSAAHSSKPSGGQKSEVLETVRSMQDSRLEQEDEVPLTGHVPAPVLRPGHCMHSARIRHGGGDNDIDENRQGISMTQSWHVSVERR